MMLPRGGGRQKDHIGVVWEGREEKQLYDKLDSTLKRIKVFTRLIKQVFAENLIIKVRLSALFI